MAELLIIGGITPEMKTQLAAKFTLHMLNDMAAPLEWLQTHGSTIEYIATNGHDGVKPAIMDALPKLKMISCYGVGYDAIDTHAANARGIMVTHTPNVLNAEVATTTLMLLLALYRELLRDDAYMRAGRWQKDGNTPLTRSVDHQTIGILGLGRIGQAIVDKLAPFHPKILYHGRTKKDVPYTFCPDLVTMAEACDVLICITPGGPQTEKLVNQAVINALGPKGTLINVSRGSVVDEAALIKALQEGRLGWAGLDVFENEPEVPEALRTLPNVVLTPHIGSATVETRAAMGQLTVDNLTQFLANGTVISPVPECQ